MQQLRIGAVILAGGKSSRMGSPKQNLPWRDGTFLTELVKEVQEVGLSCFIVANDFSDTQVTQKEQIDERPVTITPDLVPSCGPVSGLVTAFRVSSEDALLVLSCDLPFMDRGQIAKLIEFARERDDWDVIVTQSEGRTHPLCAVYHRRTQANWERALLHGQRKLMWTLEELRVVPLPDEWLDPWAVFNVNTPEEYEQAKLEEKRRKTGHA
ncbi:molybdenum cofactor guanylyltransferase [Brevibacillus sp. DP1.3A]|uniref:molybdenum cofactor guanylyltransferase n=1 Tax=Brevibacillus sp. DP1.3A TaxID=2738867 RepID=UPI00156BD695|nr:molybdenum cofactor guanylyltransferase [Brevibacillus sp. DP1.3A]UED74023.1 molybdenum cofactor guanylyltransferase [Brevibacillus sp. DP1.3A]